MKQKQRIRKQSLVRNIFIFERNNITRYHHKIVILSSWNKCVVNYNQIKFTTPTIQSICLSIIDYLLKVATIQECIKWV